eukprot:256008_1
MSTLNLFTDDILHTIEDSTSHTNIESYKYQCKDTEIKRVTLILSIYHDWNNYIPDKFERHSKLNTNDNIMSLKNAFLCNLIKSFKEYSAYHRNIFRIHELNHKQHKILSLVHNKQITPNHCGMYDFIVNHIKKYNFVSLLNDYHFILANYYEEQNSDAFEDIYNYICERIGKCEGNECDFLSQLYTNENNDNDTYTRDPKALSLIDLLNQIHCLIFHSFNIHKKSRNHSHSENISHIYTNCDYFKLYPKYIVRYANNTQNGHGYDIKECKDEKEESKVENKFKFKHFKKSLHHRSSSLFDGVVRTITPRMYRKSKSQSFSPTQNNAKRTKKQNELRMKHKMQNILLFGRTFCYWSEDKKQKSPFYVQQREKLLKNELIKINNLSIYKWNVMYEKTQQFMQCTNCKKLKANKGYEVKYAIHFGDDISIEHIISVLIYCNVHKIRYNFKKTFHLCANT